ncbi:Gfo/Idh/MocA family oxidoreductase [Shinella sp. S4-D37]|uniref:Gfo/Idh/MocA family oxidoreductase n=1 Tax=Shinella sp. S4-D37 TaxID=3161999 RepID=UPI003465B38C
MQAVALATAGENHEQYVMKAIASSKPVFCEKPLEATADACMRVVEAEVKFGRRILQAL